MIKLKIWFHIRVRGVQIMWKRHQYRERTHEPKTVARRCSYVLTQTPNGFFSSSLWFSYILNMNTIATFLLFDSMIIFTRLLVPPAFQDEVPKEVELKIGFHIRVQKVKGSIHANTIPISWIWTWSKKGGEKVLFQSKRGLDRNFAYRQWFYTLLRFKCAKYGNNWN